MDIQVGKQPEPTERKITEPEAKLAGELVVKVIHGLLPNTCPGCGGRFAYAVNDKDICDTCFLMEARQRLLYSLQDGEDLRFFADWFLKYYSEDNYDYGE